MFRSSQRDKEWLEWLSAERKWHRLLLTNLDAHKAVQIILYEIERLDDWVIQ